MAYATVSMSLRIEAGVFGAEPNPPPFVDRFEHIEQEFLQAEEDEQCKLVYASFGLAAYKCQCFEKQITNLLSLHAIATGRVNTSETLDSFDQCFRRKTLGTMLNELRSVVKCDGRLGDLLAKALERRNFLMHHFFKAHAEDWFTASRRHDLIRELQLDSELLTRADYALESIVQELCRECRLSEKDIDRVYKMMLANASSDCDCAPRD